MRQSHLSGKADRREDLFQSLGERGERDGGGGRRPQRAVGVSRNPSPRTYTPFLFLSPIRDSLVVSSWLKGRVTPCSLLRPGLLGNTEGVQSGWM